MARAGQAVATAPADAMLAGVSFGAYLVDAFWGTRPQMRGALILAGVAPWMTRPRARLPVSAHIARPDPFDAEEVFSDWAAGAGAAALDLHRYDGVGHYFLDRSLPDFDGEAARLCLDQAKSFLRQK